MKKYIATMLLAFGLVHSSYAQEKQLKLKRNKQRNRRPPYSGNVLPALRLFSQ